MVLTLDLTPEQESRLHAEAAQLGLDITTYLMRKLELELPRKFLTAQELLALPREERDRYLAAAAEDAAPLYEADIAQPLAERELTAFTALDGEPFHEDEQPEARGDLAGQSEPTRGDEIAKVRPVVVMNPDSIGRLALRIVVPITDWKDRYQAYPWMMRLEPDAVNGLLKPSACDAFQVRSVSVQRFVGKIGSLPENIIDASCCCRIVRRVLTLMMARSPKRATR